MPDNALEALIGTALFLLVRLSAIWVFVPVPGARGLAGPIKVTAILALLAALLPGTPVSPLPASPGSWALALLAEAGLGIAIGLVVGLFAEALVMAAQVAGLQAGYSYASTVDPNTEADAAILQILAQLTANLLFFALDLHHAVLRALAKSVEVFPLGGFVTTGKIAQDVISLSGAAVELGLRIALPVLVLLLLADLTLAMLGRLNAQLQLLSIAFPLKMLAGLLTLGFLTPLFPKLYSAFASRGFSLVDSWMVK